MKEAEPKITNENENKKSSLLLRILVFFLLLGIFPGYILYTEMHIPPIYHETYYAQLPEEYHRLQNTEGKRIILIGGSNIAFGLDGELMEDLLNKKGYDYTVCPFGLYGALGTSTMLDLSEESIREGDIIILSFEPTSESMSTYFGATAFLKCAEEAPSLILSLEKERAAAVVGNYLDFLHERYQILATSSFPNVEGVYAKASFSESCTMIYPRQGNAMPLGYDSASEIILSQLTIEEDFAKEVRDYCKTARAKGAQVYYSFCPINSSALADASPASMQAYFDLCNENFDCPVISDPGKYLLESGWFYDSNVHLNSAGATLRTLQLTQDLLAELGCYQALDQELPDMPQSIAEVTAVTNATDSNLQESNFFVFQSTEDQKAYLISGLTEEGSMASSLNIPSTYENKPVIGFTPKALNTLSASGNPMEQKELPEGAAFEEIRIPASIESIPDYFFLSCPRLVKIVMENRDDLCSLSEHSLDGTEDVKIFVPQKNYSLYRDGKGCEINLWSDYLSQIYTY